MQKSILMLLLVGAMVSTVMGQKNYENEWKEVESFVRKGQPQSALKIVDNIYLEAKTENNGPQFLKASLYRIKLQADYREDFLENAIRQVSQDLETSRPPVRQVLHSIQAELCWRYYQGNRYRFMDRTRLATPDRTDIKTWDLNMLLEAVTENYLASIAEPRLLQEVPLGQFGPVIETGNAPRAFRPTLYDFLAHRALEFFMNGEAGVSKPAVSFTVNTGDYFLPADQFAMLSLPGPKAHEYNLEALHILQRLIAFHLPDQDPAALIDADLFRLKFALDQAVMTGKHDLYLEALEQLSQAYPSHPGNADILHAIALEYFRRGQEYIPHLLETYRWESKKAKETCDRVIQSFPGSEGAQSCAILLHRITEPGLSVSMKYANLPDSPMLASLDFKNLSSVNFRVIKIDPAEDRELRQQFRDESYAQKYLSMTPLREWSLSIPDDGDYQGHSTRVKIDPLPKGYYILLASADPRFKPETEGIAYASFWVTGISYMSNTDRADGQLEIFVLDRRKGTPLKNARVDAFAREYNYSTRTYSNRPVDNFTTDDKGYLSVDAKDKVSRSFYLEFRHQDDVFYTENYFYLYPPSPEEQSRLITAFFTDRSIYRPGQTLYFKGIVLEKTGDRHEIKPGHASSVALYDVNGQKVAEQQFVTNEFGSFQGTFALPSGGLTGEMTIRNETGSRSFSVEEYKRPRFRVDTEPLAGDYRLNETVTLAGKATTYAGAAVDQASVAYRVVRTARFPWDYRGWWLPVIPEAEITSGATVTGADGSFNITFNAIPDLQVDPKLQPVFSYRITIDVTDITGEVQSAETRVSVGYVSLLMDLAVPGKLNKKEDPSFRLATTNLNGQPVTVEGKLTVIPLESPGRLIRERPWQRPDVFVIPRDAFLKDFPNELYDDESNPDTWPQKSPVMTLDFNAARDSVIRLAGLSSWPSGYYLFRLEATDAFGEKVEVKKYVLAYDPDARTMPVPRPFWHAVIKGSGEPGESAVILAGTSEKNVRLLYEVENRGKTVSRQWLDLNQAVTRLEIPIEEEYRGNFNINLVFVKENYSYQLSENITVPFTDKQLKISLETFRSQLAPGQQEEWRIRITGMKGEQVAGELLASMYDASLDAFREHSWDLNLFPSRYPGSGWDTRNAFGMAASRFFSQKPRPDIHPVTRTYDQLNWFGFEYYGGGYRRFGGPMMMKSLDASPGMALDEARQEEEVAPSNGEPQAPIAGETQERKEEPAFRRNFAETAFFFPNLMTDESGDVILKFTVPESLTAWKLMTLAHTRDLKTGYLEQQVVTQKELMVMPNAPRFFREGDRMAFSAKVIGMTQETLGGLARAEFFDAYTMQPIDELLGNNERTRTFEVAAGNSREVNWTISIPQGIDAILVRVGAAAGERADGEEIVIPVLPDRMLVTESLPLPVSGKGTKTFRFSKLIDASKSATLRNYRLTLEFTSNPAWYAVQALPYLVEGTHESADNLFNRYYANTLASFIANSNPKIRQVFESWKNLTPGALLSNLEKNQELKAVILSETPWVMEAKDETERKKRIALLFDLNRMTDMQAASLRKLQQTQAPNGGWAWFEGMPDNRYITQLIVTGLGKLHHLGVIDLKKDAMLSVMVQRAAYYLDERIREDYERILEHRKDKMDENNLGPVQVQYLYARSFLEDIVAISPQAKDAFGYFTGQSGRYWLSQGKYTQAMIALALHRYGRVEEPAAILRSLKENALYSGEMGMYWRDLSGYWWFEAPIERQAMLIEAFTEVTADMASVEQMKIWLLKQKQTQDWKSSRATADAIYALLLRGVDLLTSDQMAEVTLGSEKIDPLSLDGVQAEAGTGYFQASWHGREIVPEMGNVKVVKKDDGVAWGAVYWQYYERLDKITPAKTPLSIEKELFIVKNTPEGPVLEKWTGNTQVKPGDRLTVRVIIRTDRDMEFVHMKDMRAAAFEPLNAISGYRYQDGLGYYESIRDASVNFYFDYLRKGTYVFEYPLNVTQKGEFSNGITSIQCLYAPEFAAHSQGIRVKVE